MDIEELLTMLRDRSYYAGQIRHHEIIAGQSAVFDELDTHRSVRSALRLAGIENLYQHQAEAVRAVRSGSNVVLATPTASGKTLSYTIPGIEYALDQPAKLLYIAPQIALINDQYDTLSEFTDNLGFGESAEVAFFHSKLNRVERREIKASQPDVLLTTPDMLHYSILPYGHSTSHWRWLLQNLAVVAVDEIHAYRGVFGSHVSLVLRRLNRLCDVYQTDPQYVCCSATIGNPVEHAAAITGQDQNSFTLIDEDTSAMGDRHWLLWNPPLKEDRRARNDRPDRPDQAKFAPETSPDVEPNVIDTGQSPDDSGGRDIAQDASANEASEERKSNHEQAAKLCADLVSNGHQTLVFTRTRQGSERYAKRTRHHLRMRGARDLADAVVAYHANLQDSERTAVEQKLKSGNVRGVWSTNALELGIDIGSLDAVILDGYPGSVMNTFQRAGRAGRGEESCLIVLVGSDNPLDQYILSTPEELFEADPERAVINPGNKTILRDHIQCAAHEDALTPEDEAYFGESLAEIVQTATEEGLLRSVESQPATWRPTADDPNWEMDIRSIADRQITVQHTQSDDLITSLNFEAALRDVHPQAIFLHHGTTYRITEVDYGADIAYAKEIRDTSAYTRPLREKHIEALSHREHTTLTRNGNELHCGLVEMTVREEMEGYLRYDSPTDSTPAELEFDQAMPAHEIETVGMYFAIPSEIRADLLATEEVSLDTLGAGLHAIEHGLISLLPREVLCDRSDVGGLSTGYHEVTGLPTVFVHDGYPNGVGLAETAYRALDRLLRRTWTLINQCRCQDGCPSCIHSPQCGNANRHLDKAMAKKILSKYYESTTSPYFARG